MLSIQVQTNKCPFKVLIEDSSREAESWVQVSLSQAGACWAPSMGLRLYMSEETDAIQIFFYLYKWVNRIMVQPSQPLFTCQHVRAKIDTEERNSGPTCRDFRWMYRCRRYTSNLPLLLPQWQKYYCVFSCGKWSYFKYCNKEKINNICILTDVLIFLSEFYDVKKKRSS